MRHKDGTSTLEEFYLDIVPQMPHRSVAQINLATGRLELRPADAGLS